ncbi:hypothetical protein BKA67DRAFT_44269 [Truncatella angustata]|uniref:Uncharacterized protein n=1 Tax=Truncatella angustata TaxID=152316 RepID=A0A9P8UXL0_9PEZI|nr:uncharacterized protein BKA67DRAFT_44269 [Truncatella angustata]KAH6660207.1 hypothetical protein BKA67DRAFT_44269 [Truncatella angustata]
MMAAPALANLLTEAVRQIAEFIYLEHLPSLSSFALIYKTCHAAATTWRLRDIHLKIISREQLRRDVTHYLGIINRNQNPKHVRWVEIKGEMPRKQEDEQHTEAPG